MTDDERHQKGLAHARAATGRMTPPPPDTTPTSDPRKVMEDIPQGTGYHATRYDTDDQMVLTVYDQDGNTWDFRVPKP